MPRVCQNGFMRPRVRIRATEKSLTKHGSLRAILSSPVTGCTVVGSACVK
jgi:hypothetical protein